jgi:hypothetical protein
MSVRAECERLKHRLAEMAESADTDLEQRYPVNPPPVPYGLYKKLRWLAARLFQLMETVGVISRAHWQVRLRHAVGGNDARPLLIWAVGVERAYLRDACLALQELETQLPNHAPVLVTDVADFAFYSRLGWLVEYLPAISGEGEDYRERKARFLAWFYRDAPALPVNAGFSVAAEAATIRAWLRDGSWPGDQSDN